MTDMTEADLDRFERAAEPAYRSTAEAGKLDRFTVSDQAGFILRLVAEVRRLREENERLRILWDSSGKNDLIERAEAAARQERERIAEALERRVIDNPTGDVAVALNEAYLRAARIAREETIR